MAVGESFGHWTFARAGRVGVAGLVGLSLLAAGCGDDSDGDEDTLAGGSTSSSSAPSDELPSCEDVSHTVIFGFFGTITEGEGDELASWTGELATEPEARPAAADVVRAYTDLGYEVLYVTSEAGTTQVDGQPLADAVTVWLGGNGFPIGDNTRVWTWDGEGEMGIALTEELTTLGTSGVEVETAYASDPDVLYPLSTGGIPSSNLYTVGAAALDETSTSLPGEDLAGHLSDIQSQDPVCE